MQKLFSFAMLIGALWFAAYAYQGSPGDRESKSRILSLSPSKTTDEAVVASDSGKRIAVPTLPSFASDRVVSAVAAPDQETDQSATPWQTTVTPASNPVSIAPPQIAATETTMTRRDMVRAIQRELRRTGCYSGEINGSWSDRTKRALLWFLERVNATLPLDAPDEIQLTLVRAHRAAICDETCRSGQTISANGRCASNVITSGAAPSGGASGERIAALPANEQAPVAAANGAANPLPGRMSIGGPLDPGPSARAERLPWLNSDSIEQQWEKAAPPKGDNIAALEDEHNGVAIDDHSFNLPGDAIPAAKLKSDDKQGATRLQRPRAAYRPQPAADRQKDRTGYGARSVQNLFQHPLGRM